MIGKYGMGTRAVHSGYNSKSGEPRVVPIVQSTSYRYDTFDEVGDVASAKTPGYLYTRIGNPTVTALEKNLWSFKVELTR